jgi:hypothetical protein
MFLALIRSFKTVRTVSPGLALSSVLPVQPGAAPKL